MRVLVAVLLLTAFAGAAPAAAQGYLGLALAHDAERVAAAEAARQRDIALGNELSRLDAQAQTSQNLASLAAQRVRPEPPAAPRDPNAPPPAIDVSKLAAIPDAVLADSNAKVRAASQNRR